jgi:hypothetical protein
MGIQRGVWFSVRCGVEFRLNISLTRARRLKRVLWMGIEICQCCGEREYPGYIQLG